MSNPPIYKYYLWLHLIVFLFGFTGILGKLITVASTTLVWYRLLIACMGIAIYMLVMREKLVPERKGLLKIMSTGLITAAHWVCFFESIKQSNVSVGLICLSATTFFTALIEPAFHRRRLRLYEVLFGLIVIAGLAFIFKIEPEYQLGIFFGLLSALLAAIFSVINSVLVRTYKGKQISLWELAGGLVGLSLYLAITGNFPDGSLSSADFGYLLILGLVCTAFAFVVSVEVMKYLTPYTVNISINLEPIYGILLALLIFGESEKMSPEFYLGTFVILAVIFANAWYKRRENRKKLLVG